MDAPSVLYSHTLHNDAIGIRVAERDSPNDIILRCAPSDIYEQRVLLVLSRSKDRLPRLHACVVVEENGTL